ncbi:uncharacterized protein At4g18257 [Cajanus cajan]|uniref:Uncharacterized protein C3orf19 isogeny n=1 Tax=Cajanus cajan TaxID=3821 RepID=A0A151SXV2_CAJCA|nr:uncharacterized protein At4g18257 [Cajanus cajan]KYP59637.1 Uncharacterized protein C3orf19 isogeny [Cajanus cajan]
MAGEGDTAKKRVVTESLGWLTESSIMPKKHRAIAGVGASSLLELKAELYKSQEDSKKSRELSGPDVEYQRAKNKIATKDTFSAKNRGVDARAHKDKLELKAVSDGSASYAALERKAELYDKLVKGELSDEEDQEKYCVDFFRKGIEHDELPPPPPLPPPSMRDVLRENEDGGGGNDDGDDSLMFSLKPVGPGRVAGAVDSAEHKRNIREVHEEANRARDKASEIKLRRQEQLAAHREKLKQAYLRKKLEQAYRQKDAGATDHI